MAKAEANITRVAPAAPPVPTSIEEREPNSYGNLEEQICDLVRASDLATDTLQTVLNRERSDITPLIVSESERARIDFATWEVHKRALALKEFFYGDDSDAAESTHAA